MTTYGSLTTDIITEIGKEGESITAIVQTEILDAIEYYSTYHFWFNEGQYTFTTSSSLATYAWPADLLEVESMTYTYSGARYPIDAENYLDMNEYDTGTVFSQPVAYAMFNQNFRLYPIPNATYTVAVDYQKRLATLSAAADTNAWTTNAEALIKARAEKNLHAKKLRNPEMAMACAQLEGEELNRLLLQADRMLSPGRLTPSD